MDTIKTFENFNDPNTNPTEKVSISSYVTKSEFFSYLKKDKKEFIKKSIGKEFENFKKDKQGDYIIETGDPEIKFLEVPKKFVFEIKKK